jgi:hypothetical protein
VNNLQTKQWAQLKKLSYVYEKEPSSCVEELTQLANDLAVDLKLHGDVKEQAKHIRSEYSKVFLNPDGWPAAFPFIETSVQEGLKMLSLHGLYEGRTTGSRSKCSAKGCPGWFVGILWESGDQTYLCSEGWHYDAETQELEIVGGGEIIGRFVTPREILPKDKWITRDELMTRKGWRVS